MTDFLLQMGLSNACFALALAVVAMAVGAKAKRPHLAHMLWLLVFFKLMTPPIVSIPVVTIPPLPETSTAVDDHSRLGLPVAHQRAFGVAEQAEASLAARIGSVVLRHGKRWLPPIWLLGSVVVFAWSLVRVCRFDRLLATEAEVAPARLQAVAVQISGRLELRRMPMICTVRTRLSPMVWWTGGKVRIVMPATLLEQMDERQWHSILAHELAHVRRRDYLVRWLEWLACVCFWWNPVVWWAQRNLRAQEEICCDALVLSCLQPKPRSYANSLLSAIEVLAGSALRPPAMASEINSGGFLERRFKMILSDNPNRSNSPWLQAWIVLAAMVVLPLGLAQAQDYDAVRKRLGKAVKQGELTQAQAGVMLATLKKEQASAAAVEGDHDEGSIEDRLRAVGARLKGAVKAGKMTEGEAWDKWHEIKQQRIAPRLKAAVKEGKISTEQAGVIWRVIEKAETGTRLRAAVGKGELSKEEAWAKWTEYNKEDDNEQCDARCQESKKRTGAEKRHKKPDWDTIKRRIESAVESGRMTRAEADAKYKKIKQRTGTEKRRKKPDWDAVKRRIEGAVESGRMTRAEADAKYKEIRKQLAGEGNRHDRDR